MRSFSTRNPTIPLPTHVLELRRRYRAPTCSRAASLWRSPASDHWHRYQLSRWPLAVHRERSVRAANRGGDSGDSRVEDAGRVKRAPHRVAELCRRRVELPTQPSGLQPAHPVFAGCRSRVDRQLPIAHAKPTERHRRAAITKPGSCTSRRCAAPRRRCKRLLAAPVHRRRRGLRHGILVRQGADKKAANPFTPLLECRLSLIGSREPRRQKPFSNDEVVCGGNSYV